MTHTCHHLPTTPSPSTTPEDQEEISASDFCPGREREGWLLCPKLWTFRGTAWAVGFCLASLRALIELRTLYLDAWGPLSTNKSWVACCFSRTCMEQQSPKQLCGLSLRGKRRVMQVSNALAFQRAARLVSCLKLRGLHWNACECIFLHWQEYRARLRSAENKNFPLCTRIYTTAYRLYVALLIGTWQTSSSRRSDTQDQRKCILEKAWKTSRISS